MIAVMINKAGFEYDIHSLVKAFYPGEEVKVLERGMQKEPGTPEERFFELEFGDSQITFSVYEKNGENGCPARRQSISLRGGEERVFIKNALKQLIYQVLSNYTGNKLPWGTLTGIRPTKIPMAFLEQGKGKEEILRYMQDTYYISDEKGRLCIDIAQRERDLLSGIHYRDGYSVYIGIPFCPTTCLYCSFTSYPIGVWRDRVSAYLDALDREIEYTAETFSDRILDSVYIGGGTPTTLEAPELERLLRKVKSTFNFENVKEFTVEAGRADSITGEKLAVMKRFGVTRISVNPQSMKPETLKLIGRNHTVRQVEEAFHMARRAGFDNINMDLILGLPGEDEDDVLRTTGAVKKLNPDSLTVHSLAIKRASRMSQWIQENGVRTLHNTDETMKLAAAAAAEMGMKPYYLYRQKNMSGNFENVGYAREGCYGIYNILIMEEKQTIVALGAGSITKLVAGEGRIERCDNVKDAGLYIERIEEMIERKRRLFSRDPFRHNI